MRKAPSEKASDHPNRKKRGLDGSMWVSKRQKDGKFAWRRCAVQIFLEPVFDVVLYDDAGDESKDVFLCRKKSFACVTKAKGMTRAELAKVKAGLKTWITKKLKVILGGHGVVASHAKGHVYKITGTPKNPLGDYLFGDLAEDTWLEGNNVAFRFKRPDDHFVVVALCGLRRKRAPG